MVSQISREMPIIFKPTEVYFSEVRTKKALSKECVEGLLEEISIAYTACSIFEKPPQWIYSQQWDWFVLKMG